MKINSRLSAVIFFFTFIVSAFILNTDMVHVLKNYQTLNIELYQNFIFILFLFDFIFTFKLDQGYSFIVITPRSTLTQNGCTC